MRRPPQVAHRLLAHREPHGGSSVLFDLATLGELFRDGDPVVAADHEGYYLGFAAPDRLIDNGSRLFEVASSLLRRVNGVGRVRAPAEPGGKLAAIAVRDSRGGSTRILNKVSGHDAVCSSLTCGSLTIGHKEARCSTGHSEPLGSTVWDPW